VASTWRHREPVRTVSVRADEPGHRSRTRTPIASQRQPLASFSVRPADRGRTFQVPPSPLCPHRAMSVSGSRKPLTTHRFIGQNHFSRTVLLRQQDNVPDATPLTPRDRPAMTSIRRTAVRALLRLGTDLVVGYIGASPATAQSTDVVALAAAAKCGRHLVTPMGPQKLFPSPHAEGPGILPPCRAPQHALAPTADSCS
jgi:hypothetical protein